MNVAVFAAGLLLSLQLIEQLQGRVPRSVATSAQRAAWDVACFWSAGPRVRGTVFKDSP